MRAAIQSVLAIALAIALLLLFLRNADLGRVWSALASVRGDLLLLALLLTVVMAFVRAERWQYLLAPIGPTRFSTAFRTTVIGFAASFLLPARAGEVLRPYLLARQERLPVTAAFATVIVERILDLLTVIALLCAFFLFLQQGERSAAPTLFRATEVGAALAAAAGVGLLGAMFLLAGRPERADVLLLPISRVLPSRVAGACVGLLRSFAEGLAVVRRPTRLLWAMLWSVVLWLCIAAQLWVLLLAFAIALPFGATFLITALLVVGVAVPTPGGVGGTHEALRLSLTSFYGTDNDAAVGAAIVQHAVNFIPYLVAGLIFIAQDGLSMTRLRQESAAARIASETRAREAQGTVS